LQLQEYQALKTVFAGDKQVAVHHADGFLGLKAFLPPVERRGLVLIDPAYEDQDEYTRIVQSLAVALKRWATGMYAIWYPIKEKNQLARFYRALQQRVEQPILAVEFTIYPDLPQHLNGCGLVVINPPWQFAETMQELLPWLWQALAVDKQGAQRVFFVRSSC
jgi:23S rRNA (adenine2030-N6)-methyltransferase